MNEAYNYYKVFCTECGVSGRMFLDGPTMAFNGHPGRIVPPEEAIRKAVDVWNHRESDDRREERQGLYWNSLPVAEAARVMEAVKLGKYATTEHLSFCMGMAHEYGCRPLESDKRNFYRFLCTIYRYGQVQGIRAERARRKGGQRA